MGFSITSLDQIIDIATINDGCSKIAKAADELAINASYVDAAISTSGKNVCDISANPKSYSEMVTDVGTKINQLSTLIGGIANDIKSEAQGIYDSEMAIYQAYQDWLREQEKNKDKEETKKKDDGD